LAVDDGLAFCRRKGRGGGREEEADERSTRLDRGVQGEKQIDAGREEERGVVDRKRLKDVKRKKGRSSIEVSSGVE
jgi:hypothetical protein